MVLLVTLPTGFSSAIALLALPLLFSLTLNAWYFQVKDAKKTRRKENLETDTESLAGTETTDTTETTLVNDNEYSDQIDLLRHELDNMKAKCEKLEREKSDILLRRLASMETTTSKTTASEVSLWIDL